ncbi:ATP-binding protein [Paracoccus sp. JM45]|uniref:ATP-binding protein n=1 Tax=Paracoccus sp. JM45 TaxID=2283626 RepID=UPI000E6CA38A|nr:ATP-binding protein [Paracoccus sp. JM45]RJE78721.1 ATP-binding protein [Paracoccus sp. JM45]
MEHIILMQADLDRLNGVLAELTSLVADALSDEKRISFEIAVMEALANAVQHANTPDPAKDIRVTLNISPPQVSVQIVDAGNRAPDDLFKNVPAPHEVNQMSESGRGVPLIHMLADKISFTPGDGGNSLEMIFNRSVPS